MSGNILIFTILTGISGGIITALIPKKADKQRKVVTLITTLLTAVFVWLQIPSALQGSAPVICGSIGTMHWRLQPDPLGIIFAVIASTLWVVTAVYSFGYMKHSEHQRNFYTFYLFSLAVTMGIALSANLFLLYVFYELLTFTTYPLVIHYRNEESLKAGNRYILYSLVGAGFILAALVTTAIWTGGNLNFSTVPLLTNIGKKPGIVFVLIAFIIGFGVKAAVMPIHRWLPAAMVAPTPVSALLHAVSVVYSGVYGILRVVYSVFGHELMGQLNLSNGLLLIASFTILVGVFIATKQDVLKRRLAYHTISQLSYILLGAFTLQPWGLTGAILHMISYSMLKVTLFFCAGIIAEQTGETKVSRMTGVGWALPKTMTAFGIASLGMIGMLPLNTFWSKYYLMKGSTAGGKWPFALVLIGSGIINAVCFIPTVVTAFRGKKVRSNAEQGGNVTLMLAPTLVLATAALFIGLWPGVVWPGVEAVVNWFF